MVLCNVTSGVVSMRFSSISAVSILVSEAMGYGFEEFFSHKMVWVSKSMSTPERMISTAWATLVGNVFTPIL